MWIFPQSKWKKNHMKKSCGSSLYISMPNFRTLRSVINNFEIFEEGPRKQDATLAAQINKKFCYIAGHRFACLLLCEKLAVIFIYVIFFWLKPAKGLDMQIIPCLSYRQMTVLLCSPSHQFGCKKFCANLIT